MRAYDKRKSSIYGRLYQEGYTDEGIARLTDSETDCVRSWRVQHGYESNHSKWRKEIKEEVMRLVKTTNIPKKDIAEMYGVTPQAVNKWIREEAIRMGHPVKTVRKPVKVKTESTLCWTCDNSYEGRCPWFHVKDPQPVEGWDAVRQDIRYSDTHEGAVREIESYLVRGCPNYSGNGAKEDDNDDSE